MISPVTALEELQQAIVDAPSHPSHDLAIVRVSVGIKNLDLLDWLAAQTQSVKTYWRNREANLEIAGVGVADELDLPDGQALETALDILIEKLSLAGPGVRYFGGVRFDPDIRRSIVSDQWKLFGVARFVLPRFEIVRDANGSYLSCNILQKELGENTTDELATLVETLVFDSPAVRTIEFSPEAREDEPDRRGWSTGVRQAVEGFAHGEIEKLVLTRRSTFQVTGCMSPWELLSRLRRTSNNCYLFGLQPGKDVAFIGTTPERLYHREGSEIHSEALAGTRPRGLATEQDSALENELLASEKERVEHGFVVDNLTTNLGRLCDSLEVTHEREIVKLHRVQHLRSRFAGVLRRQTSDTELLCQLPPTPAVAGYPVDAACAELQQIESFDRGWFAGPVGWLSSDAAEFAVAIRSALIQDNSLTLYSGAGIVEGSRPADEWQEIESKIAHYLQALGESKI